MRSLPQVLHEAASQSASEIILEAGQAPMIRTVAGSVTVGDVFAEQDLFDALAQVLAPEQQAELAVGNVVEFHVDSGTTRWSLVTEPGAEGIVVRGRSASRTASEDEVGVPLELPPLEHSELDADRAPDVSGSVFRRGSQRRTALDLAARSSTDADPSMPQASTARAESAAPSTRSDGRPSWLETGGSFGDDAGSETQDGSERGSIDFEVRSSAAVEVDDMGRPDAIELPDAVPGEASVEGEFTTRPTTAVKHAAADPDDDPFVVYARSLTPGTMCLVRGWGAGSRLARSVPGPDAVLVDAETRDDVLGSALDRNVGTTYLVRLEDPSNCLGWILRRLEEGARVIVETRARTLEGARRCLLGLTASVHASAWLDAHALCWLAEEDGTWRMTG